MEQETAPNHEGRGFRIGDTMILVAAVAFGLFLSRTTLRSFLPDPPRTLLKADTFGRMRDSLPYVASFLLAGTIACLILSFRQGRGTHARRLDSPGMAAATAATCVIALQSAATALLMMVGTRSDFIASPLSWGMSAYPGAAVGGTWAVLRLGGRWSAGCSSVDRFGVILGMGWIGITLAHWLGFALIR